MISRWWRSLFDVHDTGDGDGGAMAVRSLGCSRGIDGWQLSLMIPNNFQLET